MDNNYYNPYTNPNNYTNTETTNYQYNPQPKKSGFGKTLAKTVAIALVFGLVAGGVGTATMGLGLTLFDTETGTEGSSNGNGSGIGGGIGSINGNQTSNNNGSSVGSIPNTDTDVETAVSLMDVSELVENAMPCIVAITNLAEIKVQNIWGQSYTQEATSCGTGFLVEQDEDYLYIATNNHVVADAKKLTVQFNDGAEVEAKIKGQVASKDLAVIMVALKDLSAETASTIRIATLGDSNVLRVGEGAIAIGNALGYGQSVTTGVVSALGRSVTVTDSSTGLSIVNNNLIQTDAAINPGNSGGALFNIKGEVIGINSVKYADTDVEGIGYAIPISDAMLVIEKLISGEQIDVAKAGYLGIQGLDSNYGVYVYKVFSGSAAEDAGIRVGDIIIGLEGNQISSMSQLKELLSYYSAGQEVTLVVMKANGNEYVEKNIKVVLGDSSTINQ